MTANDHGSASTYRNWACRCDECKAAHAAYTAILRDRRAKKLTADDPRHGDYSTYFNYRCRCEACRTAKRDYDRQRPPRRKRVKT